MAPHEDQRRYEGRILPNQQETVFDQGLRFDIDTLMSRRGMLRAMGAAVAGSGVLLAGCTVAGPATARSTTTAAGSTAAATGAATAVASPAAAASAMAADCTTAIPEETAGPFPGDGSNGPDVLAQSGVVRSDIRSSFGSMSGTAAGVPLTIQYALIKQSDCRPYANAAVYSWQCDREGRYSLYNQGVTNQNYLRGVQQADANGIVTFQSIFPAAYSGRWPHVHYEVFPTLALANDDKNSIATSQLALPKEVCDAVYATEGYSASIRTLSQVTLARDGVFRDDGGVAQLGAMSGDINRGLTVTLPVVVRA